ncbi:MAG: magnesium/cobalt efflux protein [Spirochaetales bacterium]|nr:magnesium/cobalt efflux protein [Spirochaetales bacterium]
MKRIGFLEKLLGKALDEEEDLGDLSGDPSPYEREMIRGILKLSDTSVRDILVPRTDTVFVSVDTPQEELIDILTECGHSRVPVYDGTIDSVVGVLYVKDLLIYIRKEESIDVTKLLRKPYLIPESKKLDSLLREFQRRRVHIAVVIDEYGGVSGIVALEDIIEEIVGDIQDEYDNEREDILEIGDGVYLCEARVDVEELNEQIGLNLPTENIDTLGGFVFDLFGKIPIKFEKATYEGKDFIIQDMDAHKIKTVKIVTKGSRGEV